MELVTPGTIVLDGKLDEAIYQTGDWQGGFKTLTTQQPAPYSTEFRAFTDGTIFYFAAKVQEPGGKMVAKERERDGRVWGDDCLELFLQANGDASEFLHILVSARGVVADIKYGQGGHTKEHHWNTSAKAAVGLQSDGWHLEFAVPLAELDTDPSLDRWKWQVARERAPREGEGAQITTWSPVSGPLAQPYAFGVLSLPAFDRSLLGWKVAPGEAKVIRKEDGYYLRQPVRVLNQTGRYRNVTLTSIFVSDAAARGSKSFGLADGRAMDAEVEIFLADQPKRDDLLRHEVAISQNPEQMLAFASQEVVINYTPAEVKWITPGYRSLIFASQNLKTIEAELKLIDESLTLSEVSALLHGDDGRDYQAAVESKDGKRWKITLAQADALPEGSYRLEVKFQSNGSDRKLERTLTKLPFRKGEVWIDERGVVHREGKPFPAYGFCFGNWDKIDEDRWPGVKMSVAMPVFASPPFDAMFRQVDHLAKSGIYSVIYAATASKTGLDRNGKNPLTEKEKEEYRALARIAREHPFVLAYYHLDEPEGRSLHPLRFHEIYEILREEDPYHPVIVLNNTLEGTRDFQYSADISTPDPYPLFLENGGSARPLERMGRFLDQIATGEESYRAKWLTPQGFNYGNYNAEGNRGPTAREMRTQQIIGLIHGVTGITWYGEPMGWDEPGVFTSLPYLSQEFYTLFPLLAAARPERLEVGEGWSAALSLEGKKAALLVANLLFEEREVTINDSRLASVTGWNKLGTSEKLTGGKPGITLKLKPYEAIILASDTVPFPEELDWSIVEKAEAAAWQASRVPGNIAHRSTGAKATGVKTPTGSHLRPMMTIDGMKDPRGSGFRQRGFQPGMGIEIDFGQERQPARLLLIGSTIHRARVEQQNEAGEWIGVSTIEREDQEFTSEVILPATNARRIRLLVDALTEREKTLYIREIEIYEK